MTSRVVDKFAQIVVDGVRYQAPISCAYKPVVVKLFADRVKIVAGTEVVTDAARSFERGKLVLDARHVLDLLLHKPRVGGHILPVLHRHADSVFQSDDGVSAVTFRRPLRWLTAV